MAATTAPPQPAPEASPSELEEIRQYQQIVDFRDSVLAGTHPRIKVPAPSTRPAQSASTTSPTTQAAAKHGRRKENHRAFQANAKQPVAGPTSKAGAGPSDAGGGDENDEPGEIHQTELDKANDLEKTELKTRRYKLEQALKAQLDQRKAANRAAVQQSDQDLNISDILAKALTLVQATAAPLPQDAQSAASESDSFDDNTFYSSHHDTPDPLDSPRVQQPAAHDISMTDARRSPSQQDSYSPTLQFSAQPAPAATIQAPAPSNHSSTHPGGPSIPNPVLPNNPALLANMAALGYPLPPAPTAAQWQQQQQQQQPQPQQWQPPPQVLRPFDTQAVSSGDSAAASRSGDSSGDTDPAQSAGRIQPHQVQPPPPHVVRSHDLQPYAPRPEHVSPLAAAHNAPVYQPGYGALQGAPAPVAALRQEHAPVTSPESSSQGEKGGKKKNKKNKNKKKADGRAQNGPPSPVIKPEPRSPSPLSAPAFTRPQKRRRVSQVPTQDLTHDEPRLERPASHVYEEYNPARPVEVLERLPAAYERSADPYSRPLRRQSFAPGYSGEPMYEEIRPDSVQYVRRVYSPAVPSPVEYTSHYGAGDARPLRSATYSTTQPAYREEPGYPRDGRISTRPYGDRTRSRSPVMADGRAPMGPPPMVSRIVVDQFGRQYIEPPPQGVAPRQSVAPPPRLDEPEIIYERAPTRAISRVPGPDTFTEDGIVYRRASPMSAPRRVVTQPEYGGGDRRGYRERDYSTQPIHVPAREYVQYREPLERHVAAEYPPRAASIRPADAGPMYGRVQSVRPEMAFRQYTSSVHPEQPDLRQDGALQPIREYSIRPNEAAPPGREYSARPPQPYYDQVPQRDHEITYIERPRAAQPEIVYANDPRRASVYR